MFHTDVIVQFIRDTFTTTEAAGTMTVDLILFGGILDKDLTVTVTTMEQTATGIIVLLNSIL